MSARLPSKLVSVLDFGSAVHSVKNKTTMILMRRRRKRQNKGKETKTVLSYIIVF